jgi:hypothetical protein
MKRPYVIKENSRLRLGGKEHLPGETVHLTQKEVYQYWRCLVFTDMLEIEEMQAKINEEYNTSRKQILEQAMDNRGFPRENLNHHGLLHS